mmetsp:Transcript_16132/g.24337  ORF Transcript_16132/g.24337 Transcript_16132/m.24337 type:complete len:128 (+) Transcript_16132:42-425(+)
MATLFWKVFLLFAGILPAVRGRSQRMNVVGNRLNFMFGRNRIVSVRGENEDEMRQQLMQSEARLTGGMLRELLLAKFGREYDLRLTRRRDSLGKKENISTNNVEVSWTKKLSNDRRRIRDATRLCSR